LKYWFHIMTLAGAYLGLLIGSGVATGQELMQYYTPYGFQMFGTAAIIATILIVANFCFAYIGKQKDMKNSFKVFSYCCGPFLGRIFSLFTTVFCYMLFVVMVAGGAATLHEQYGIPLIVGALVVAVASALTVASGLDKLVKIIGEIAPALLLCILVISLISLCGNIESVVPNIDKMNSGALKVTKASSNWIMSGISNGGFCILTLAFFSAALGAKENFRDLVKANVLSSVLFVIIETVIALSILSQLNVVSMLQIPNLFIAKEIWSPLGSVFGILIFLAIYTTASPLLWVSTARFSKELTVSFHILPYALGALGVLIALYAPYNILLHYIFVINGYLGFIVLLIMVIKTFKMIKASRKKLQL